MKLTIGFSPCPNDTFIFDALINGKIDTEAIEFETVLEDVETLNNWAFEGKLDITKLSYPAFFQSLDKYVLLNSGAALGKGVGPLLISKLPVTNDETTIENSTIALPGKNTTANLLFSFAYPFAIKKNFMLFSAIENAVLNRETELGVIIHENRFTYEQKGLKKVVDLGEYWEEKMKSPIPLGGIAIRRSLNKELCQKVERLIRKSLDRSFAGYPTITNYVKMHSQEMEESVMQQHIELYVNNYSLELGEDGKKAITTLYETFLKMNPEIKETAASLFL